ncbi:hypothetical protein NQ318_018051 [Aromia moschata]|uniref:Transposase n=1 Tax=Aromia moschata TaxID=1265417 RepID=A0AAV8ZCP2_9CUCU|nr:hypothetical protein NQ318_018051 [Aromia moschata]
MYYGTGVRQFVSYSQPRGSVHCAVCRSWFGLVHHHVAMGDADDDRTVAFLPILTTPNFTNQELTDIVLCYGASGNNALQAQRRDQRNFSVNVWCGIVGDVLIGPHILPDRLTGNGYLNFLQHVLPNLLEEVPLGILRQMWYLHDGAPPHFVRQVRDFLNVEYPNRWIGRNGPIHWPARSPDLTPCDFYLWGHMKQLVYSEPVNSIEELTARIRVAAETIREDPTDFGRVRASLERRARDCIDNNGLQFQHLP